jgi:hypothetical protein
MRALLDKADSLLRGKRVIAFDAQAPERASRAYSARAGRGDASRCVHLLSPVSFDRRHILSVQATNAIALLHAMHSAHDRGTTAIAQVRRAARDAPSHVPVATEPVIEEPNANA